MAETEKTIETMGLRAMELFYEPVINMDFGTVIAYRSQLRINSPDRGVILPIQYLPVAQRTLQASKLSLWNLSEAVNDIVRLTERKVVLEWASVYVPSRLLLDAGFDKNLSNEIKRSGVDPSKLCLEFPGELLFEDSSEVKERLTAVRSMGVKTMLCDYGSEFCPLVRINSTRTDFVLLDPTVTGDATCDDEIRNEIAQGVVGFVEAVNAVPIASGVTKDHEEVMGSLCTMSVGKLAGKYKKAAGIRA